MNDALHLALEAFAGYLAFLIICGGLTMLACRRDVLRTRADLAARRARAVRPVRVAERGRRS